MTAAAGHQRIQGFVFIAALAPDEGETVADVFYRDPAHPQAPELTPTDEGWIWLPTNAFGTAFAQQATADRIGVLAAVQRPIAVACVQEPVPRLLWKHLPSWYLIAEQDRMINHRSVSRSPVAWSSRFDMCEPRRTREWFDDLAVADFAADRRHSHSDCRRGTVAPRAVHFPPPRIETRLESAHGREARRARGQAIGRPKALDESKANLARRMHASGEAVSVIGHTLGVSRATVYRVLAETEGETTG